MTRFITFLSLLLSFCSGYSQTHTGLKVFKDFDSTRIFDTLESSAMHYRPLKIDLFYPSATTGNNQPLKYGEFLKMYSHRMDYTITADSAMKVGRELGQAFVDYLKLDSVEQYLNYETGIYTDLQFPSGKYPLIIYAAGMNGSSWENVVLFDSLCKAGYAVAAISSVGLYPGFMSTAPDITEQVNDILLVKKRLSALSFVDSNKVGLLSWSMGGSAAVKATMVAPFKCLMSYDGTEIHYYGREKEWDKQFDEMQLLEPSNPSAVTIPYLYVSSDRQRAMKMYDIMQHISSKEKFFVKIKNGTHEDFSSIVTIANRIKHAKDNRKERRIWELTRTFFDQYLKGNAAISVKDFIGK